MQLNQQCSVIMYCQLYEKYQKFSYQTIPYVYNILRKFNCTTVQQPMSVECRDQHKHQSPISKQTQLHTRRPSPIVSSRVIFFR